MLKRIVLIVIFSILISSFVQGESGEETLLPTEALHLIFQELSGDFSKQEEVAKKYLEKAKKNDLTPAEEFALGEIYFVARMPRAATTTYSKFSSGDDLKARIAWQRTIFMKIRAFQNVPEGEKEIPAYRKKFSPTPEDLFHLVHIVSDVATSYQTKGNHEKVVELVTEEFLSMPLNTPYYSLALPAIFFESFKQTGKEQIAFEMIKTAKGVYDKALSEKKVFLNSSPKSPETIEHKKDTFHRREQGLFNDYPQSEGFDPMFKRFYEAVNSIKIEVKDEETLLPTDALHLIFQERGSDLQKQPEIAKKYLAKVKKTNLDKEEEFALAEVYYASLMAKDAAGIYQKFTDGKDWRARLARQKIMWMRLVLPDTYQQIEEEIKAYRKLFSPTSTDLFHLFRPVTGVANHYVKAGNHTKVVQLIVEELATLSTNAPYYSYGLVANFWDSFKQAGKEKEGITILKKVQKIYRNALAKKTVIIGETKAPPEMVEHQKGNFHRVEQGLYTDYKPSERIDVVFKKQYDAINSILLNNKN